MILKKIAFDNEAKEGLRLGIETLSRAVKSTLGPRGQTVIIEAEDILRSRTVTKDGATVAKYVNLNDSIQDMAVNIMRDGTYVSHAYIHPFEAVSNAGHINNGIADAK